VSLDRAVEENGEGGDATDVGERAHDGDGAADVPG
jgi:hypothetical protein